MSACCCDGDGLVTCENCCGDGVHGSACVDDLCHGGDIPCMHGNTSEIICDVCHGDGCWPCLECDPDRYFAWSDKHEPRRNAEGVTYGVAL